MPSAAKKLVIVRNNDAPAGKAADAPAAQARPEELRLLEALLFAAGQPLDEATLSRRLPNDVDVKDALGGAQGRIRHARRQPGAGRQEMDVPHRRRSVVAAHQGDGGDAQAVARGDRDARHHRLSPAGHARRDRGNPRRGGGGRHARRAAAHGLDPAARAAQGAGPADHLRHDRTVPHPFRAGGGGRSARPRGTQRRRPAWRAICRRALRCRCRPTTAPCATTRTRSIPAISILGLAPPSSRSE